MPRSGQNPMKWTQGVYKPQRITIAVLVYIPFLGEYWEQSLDVLRICLESIRVSTPEQFDLMVFDNGSCLEVKQFLLSEQDGGRINCLILSEKNVGKVGAWNLMFAAAPGDIIVYSDSDVLFLPGWLEESLRVLEAFPKVGMITAQPARRGLPRFCQTTLREAKQDPTIEIDQGDLLPHEFIEWCRYGLGRSPEEHKRLIQGHYDIRLRKGTTEAFVSADHFQFLTTKKALQRFLPFNVTIPLGGEDDCQLDRGMDEAGFWRLSLSQFLVHHLGNRLQEDQDLEKIFKTLEINSFELRPNANVGTIGRVENTYLRKLLKRLNALSYRLLYQ